MLKVLDQEDDWLLMLDNLKNVPIPEAYKGDKHAEQRFLGAVHGNVNNAVADV